MIINRTNLINTKLNVPINNQYGKSIQSELNKDYLDLNINNEIGTPMNFEKGDYNFIFPTLNLDVFFNIKNTAIYETALANLLDDNWVSYYGLVKAQVPESYYYSQSRKITSPRGHLDNVISTETTVRNNVVTMNETWPTFNGIPSYYNSFGYLYYTKAEDLNYQYDNRAFFYNSFLKVDFYTTNDFTTQSLVFSKVIYNNKRYLAEELGYQDKLQPKSTYVLNQECDGYVLNWSIETPVTTLYARFSYYDAFSGRTIALVPSAKVGNDKLKWIQNPSEMLNQELYLKYELNTISDQYMIKAYKSETNEYLVVTDTFDLYELVIDKYWAENASYIKVERDIDVSEVVVTNEPDAFRLESDKLLIHKMYKPTDAEYTKHGNFYGGGEPREYNVSEKDGIRQVLKNTGQSDLKLHSISIEPIGELSIGGGYGFIQKPSVYRDVTNLAHWSENPRTYIQSKQLFIDTDITFYYKGIIPDLFRPDSIYNNVPPIDFITSETDYSEGEVLQLIQPYQAWGFDEKCRPRINEDDVHDSLINEQMPITLDVIFNQKYNKLIHPGEEVNIDFNIKVGDTFVRGAQEDIFDNLLVYDDYLVTINMEDPIGGEVVSKTFVIDFRFLSLRFTGLDYMAPRWVFDYDIINYGWTSEEYLHQIKYDGLTDFYSSIAYQDYNEKLKNHIIGNYTIWNENS